MTSPYTVFRLCILLYNTLPLFNTGVQDDVGIMSKTSRRHVVGKLIVNTSAIKCEILKSKSYAKIICERCISTGEIPHTTDGRRL